MVEDLRNVQGRNVLLQNSITNLLCRFDWPNNSAVLGKVCSWAAQEYHRRSTTDAMVNERHCNRSCHTLAATLRVLLSPLFRLDNFTRLLLAWQATTGTRRDKEHWRGGLRFL